MQIAYSTVKEKCLFAISEADRIGDIDTFLLFTLLYQTGFRIDEVLYIKGWVLTEDGRIYIPPHKRGRAKIISQLLVPSVIIDEIRASGGYSFLGSFSTYQRQFLSLSGLHNCYVGKKRITLHSFRHVFIKQKVSEDIDISTINEMLGIRKTSTTLQYIYKEYHTEPFLVDEIKPTFL